jgi:hypothetical protein
MANNSSSTIYIASLPTIGLKLTGNTCPVSVNPMNIAIIYLKVAQENGKEGDTRHLQGCVVFDSKYKQWETKVSKILMGPNKNTALPDPTNPGKCLPHHYHVKTMRGTYQDSDSHND